MKKIILIAAIIYFILGLITFHPDNKGVLKWVSRDYKKVWNIYEYTEREFKDSVFNYPPMNFVITKLEWPVSLLLGGNGYYEWLNQNDEVAVYDPLIFRYNFATKFPLILVALFVGWQIYDLVYFQFKDRKRALLAGCFWLLNPITLYSIPVMGQNDVLAIAFFLAGWKVLYSNIFLSSILFGFSISIKNYPLIWLVFILALQWKGCWKRKITVLGLSYFIYFLTTIPFLSTPAFTKYVLNSSINNRFFISQIDIGQEESILIIPLLLLVTFMLVNYQALKNPRQIVIRLGLLLW